MAAMKKVTGQFVKKPKYKPLQTPIKAVMTEITIICGKVRPRYLATFGGKVSKIKTNKLPTICAPIETETARISRK